jgi:isoquinoline 1-oxidoreductase subunit alpha
MIQLKINGVEQSFNGEAEMPLLWYLRDILGLTGSKLRRSELFALNWKE